MDSQNDAHWLNDFIVSSFLEHLQTLLSTYWFWRLRYSSPLRIKNGSESGKQTKSNKMKSGRTRLIEFFESMKKRRSETTLILRAILISSKVKSSPRELCAEFKEFVGRDIDPEELGYNSVEDFIKNAKGLNLDEYVHAEPISASEHIRNMVHAQKSPDEYSKNTIGKAKRFDAQKGHGSIEQNDTNGVKSPHEKITGTVKRFIVHKGYGFIERHDTKEDVFFHQKAIVNQSLKKTGDVVSFNIIATNRKHDKAI